MDTQEIPLTEIMIPREIPVLRFDPGKLLRIRLPIPWFSKILFFVKSLMFYLLGAQGLCYVLGRIIHIPPEVPLLLETTAISLCIFANWRGATLSLLLAEQRLRVVTPISWKSVRCRLKVRLSTTKILDQWVCDLSINGYVVAKSLASIDAASAERPFTDFAAAFPSVEDPEDSGPGFTRDIVQDEPPREDVQSSLVATNRQDLDRVTDKPLVFLVYGTWATRSLWAIPDRSKLVTALRSRVTQVLEFRRFCWSGANKQNSRLEAADRLANEMRLALSSSASPIFVLAHSHGGNIAVRAFETLSQLEQRNVKIILMATPFLCSGRRFNVRDIYDALPGFIRRNLKAVCVMGSFSWAYIAFSAKKAAFLADEPQLLPFATTLGRLQFPLIALLFFCPFVLFGLLWRKGEQMFAMLPPFDPDIEWRRNFRDPSSFLVLAYSQDEAFQALSVVINLLSIFHQMMFLGILSIAWLSARFKAIDALAVLPWIIMELCSILVATSVSGFIVLNSIADKLVILKPLVATMRDRGYVVFSGYIFPAVDYSFKLFLILIFLAATAILASMISMLIAGAFRISVFYFIGVLEQMCDQTQFLNSVLGTVSISMLPIGPSESAMVDGHALFNHVKIYDDEQAIRRICEFIQRTLKTESQK
ncbi:alpha/beta fold hydrolase [Paraburkholderia sp. RL17-337-BIB-A]|uniref:alpha/beta fold hydrolase n=1 Tax=Paraburkholderia sp. RL17-337-BIB-A TaxID=3031636 RepID=UPI0038B96439